MAQKKSALGFTFSKNQRLTHKKRIAEIFENGNAIKAFPLRAKCLPNELTFHRILIAVPKRTIPLATQRNQIKRLIREAFRLNQHQFSSEHANKDFMIFYTGKKNPTYFDIEKKLLQLGKEAEMICFDAN